LLLQPRAIEPELGDTLWLNDPDGNLLEIGVTSDNLFARSASRGRFTRLTPLALQHVALYTDRLEEMVEFYTDALALIYQTGCCASRPGCAVMPIIIP